MLLSCCACEHTAWSLLVAAWHALLSSHILPRDPPFIGARVAISRRMSQPCTSIRVCLFVTMVSMPFPRPPIPSCALPSLALNVQAAAAQSAPHSRVCTVISSMEEAARKWEALPPLSSTHEAPMLTCMQLPPTFLSQLHRFNCEMAVQKCAAMSAAVLRGRQFAARAPAGPSRMHWCFRERRVMVARLRERENGRGREDEPLLTGTGGVQLDFADESKESPYTASLNKALELCRQLDLQVAPRRM